MCKHIFGLKIFTTIEILHRLGVLASNGYCRPFDKDATGYTRSEAISVVFIQKAKDAKRIYTDFIYSKANCDGYKEEGITFPSGKMQKRLLKEFYEDLEMDPREVDYVEAHSTGTIVGDPEECGQIITRIWVIREYIRNLISFKISIKVEHWMKFSALDEQSRCQLAVLSQTWVILNRHREFVHSPNAY